jgi:hypothetical protein
MLRHAPPEIRGEADVKAAVFERMQDVNVKHFFF